MKFLVSLVLLATIFLFIIESHGQDFRELAGFRRRNRDSCEGSRRSTGTTTTATTTSTSRNSCSRQKRSAQDCAQFLNAELRESLKSSADYWKIKYIRVLMELNSRQISDTDDFTSADVLFWKNVLNKLDVSYAEKCPAPELV